MDVKKVYNKVDLSMLRGLSSIPFILAFLHLHARYIFIAVFLGQSVCL